MVCDFAMLRGQAGFTRTAGQLRPAMLLKRYAQQAAPLERQEEWLYPADNKVFPPCLHPWGTRRGCTPHWRQGAPLERQEWLHPIDVEISNPCLHPLRHEERLHPPRRTMTGCALRQSESL